MVIMKIEDVHIGWTYKVDAPGTNSHESWTVKSKRINGVGDWEVIALGTHTPYSRVFYPSSFVKEVKKSNNGKIVLDTDMDDGALIEQEQYDRIVKPLRKKRK